MSGQVSTPVRGWSHGYGMYHESCVHHVIASSFNVPCVLHGCGRFGFIAPVVCMVAVGCSVALQLACACFSLPPCDPHFFMFAVVLCALVCMGLRFLLFVACCSAVALVGLHGSGISPCAWLGCVPSCLVRGAGMRRFACGGVCLRLGPYSLVICLVHCLCSLHNPLWQGLGRFGAQEVAPAAALGVFFGGGNPILSRFLRVLCEVRPDITQKA